MLRPMSDVEFVQSVVFLYTDDVTLLALSVFALQVLVGICAAELEFLDMAINVKKSACVRVGQRYTLCAKKRPLFIFEITLSKINRF